MVDDKVRLVKPGKTYLGHKVWPTDQVLKKNCWIRENLYEYLTMPSGVHPVPHVHKDIETIAYLLGGGVLSFSRRKFRKRDFS